MNQAKIIELKNDIKEIENLLNTEPFDMDKGISILEKHKKKDVNVAAVNSPLTPNFVPYRYATDEMLKNNLFHLMEYLSSQLAIESAKV